MFFLLKRGMHNLHPCIDGEAQGYIYLYKQRKQIVTITNLPCAWKEILTRFCTDCL